MGIVQKKIFLALIACSLGIFSAYAQEDLLYPDTLNKKRLNGLIIGGASIYAGSMIALYNAWYKNYPQSSFHFTNDNSGWLQVDKMGHMMSAYYIGDLGYYSLRWAGLTKKKAIWYGGLSGFAYLTVIEILDGFSAEWGASPGDLVANTLGSAIFISQQLIWDDQRFRLKWSYYPTDYRQYNPEVLGETAFQAILKDYNGHTYWLSMNVKSFMFRQSRFPSWLSVSLGYGAKGMLGANANPEEMNGNPLPKFDRIRQYYFSLDVDLSKIKTRKKGLLVLFRLVNFIKIPFPTLEYNPQDAFTFHWIYM